VSRALIIGGTGFLGRTLEARASEAGLETFVLAPDLDPALAESNGRMIAADVAARDELDRALALIKPHVVFHLAAFGVGGEGLIRSAALDPVQATCVNVLGFVTSCQVAAEHDVQRFVWSSSTSVFGPMSVHGPDPLGEDVKPEPDTIYGATKLAAERLAGLLPFAGSTSAVGLRLPAVYGAGRYPGALRAFTEFVDDVASGRPARFEAGPQPYDWIHVGDAADALLLAYRQRPPRSIYNVVGHRSTLEEMARAVASHATAPVEITVGGAGDPPALMDGSRFERELGFAPRFDLERGIEEYVTSTRRQEARWKTA
jgi:nucleoside-diphosphate-sugar epimerase